MKITQIRKIDWSLIIAMKTEDGCINFPLWLIGDSEPEAWKKDLSTPFDSRHPIIHNIWTPIIDNIQGIIFDKLGKRINSKAIYIRNAVTEATHKPDESCVTWQNRNLLSKIVELREIIDSHMPIVLLTFGAFSFEFCRRVLGENGVYKTRKWNTTELGKEFTQRTINFDDSRTNIIPLLHRSISGGHFLVSHRNFCFSKNANYFEYVALSIAKIFIENKVFLTRSIFINR